MTILTQDMQCLVPTVGKILHVLYLGSLKPKKQTHSDSVKPLLCSSFSLKVREVREVSTYILPPVGRMVSQTS